MKATRKIFMIVSSNLDWDLGVQKEALSAHKARHEVLVACRCATSDRYPCAVYPTQIARSNRTVGKLLERIFLVQKPIQVGIDFATPKVSGKRRVSTQIGASVHLEVPSEMGES